MLRDPNVYHILVPPADRTGRLGVGSGGVQVH